MVWKNAEQKAPEVVVLVWDQMEGQEEQLEAPVENAGFHRSAEEHMKVASSETEIQAETPVHWTRENNQDAEVALQKEVLVALQKEAVKAALRKEVGKEVVLRKEVLRAVLGLQEDESPDAYSVFLVVEVQEDESLEAYSVFLEAEVQEDESLEASHHHLMERAAVAA